MWSITPTSLSWIQLMTTPLPPYSIDMDGRSSLGRKGSDYGCPASVKWARRRRYPLYAVWAQAEVKMGRLRARWPSY